MVRVSFEEGGRIRKWKGTLDRPKGVLKQIGLAIEGESQMAFRRQKLGKIRWEPRAPVNAFGVISDFANGRKAPKARRFDRRPALVDTGALAQSIASRLIGSHAVETGANKHYADVQHRGGETQSEKMTGQVRKALWRWLKRQDKNLKAQLGWVLNKKFKGKKIKQTVPARPIVAITRTVLRDIDEIVLNELKGKG